jgi:hypothetical protein
MFGGIHRLGFHGPTGPTTALVGLLTMSIVPMSLGSVGAALPAGEHSSLQNSLQDRRWTLDEILDALRRVESGGVSDPSLAVGDGGEAIGPYQIHYGYWQDADVPGAYEDCRDLAYARRVVIGYWRRYCPQALGALEAEVLARVHNGGPKGHAKRSTEVFWIKVRRVLTETKNEPAPGETTHET